MGWILPLMVVVALGIIGYLLLVPGAWKSGDAPQPDTAAPTEGAATADSGSSAVERAAEAAAAARRSVIGTPSYATAATLDAVFNADPIGAAARYPGRVRVTGVIASMVAPGSTPSLSMEGRTPFNFMVVNFPDGYRTRLIPLVKGQSITVTCEDARSLAGTTILEGCLLD